MLLALLGAAAAGCTPVALPPPAPDQPFDAFVDRVAADWMRADPTAATAQQYFSGSEQDALDRQLTAKDFQYGTPLDPAERAVYVERARAALEELQRYPRRNLDPQQRISAAVLDWQLGDAVRAAQTADDRYVFEQFRGLQIGLVNFMSQTHPIRNARDIDNYLARLAQMGPVLDRGIEQATAREQQGVIPPRFILHATIDGIDRFLAAPAAQNVLVASLDQRAAKLKDLPAADRAAAVAAAGKIVTDSVLPAFHRVRDLLASELAQSTDDAGLWHLPHGAEAYAAALHVNTTTEMTPGEIAELGQREVVRIEREMDGLLRQLGYTEGTVGARFDMLEASVQPPSEPDPRPGLIAEHERILRDAERRSEALFDLHPSAPVQVLREPPFTEKGAAAHYTQPAADGSRPGTVWIPLPGPPYQILEMRTLTYHEGVPGHHFQVALQQELPQIPAFRRKRVFGGLAAFTEGWALYAEQLAAESGWYEGDPRGRLGQLNDELFRARRLVTDTGLHTRRWTRRQAIDYGISPTEVDRYVVMAGQACAYKIGELEILKQRARMQQALGDKFSLKEFNDLLLRTGAVPLAVLGEVVDDDIVAIRAGRPPG
jgi:uncharacterized protein (DUF885 family)